jgi:hypothetical protein
MKPDHGARRERLVELLGALGNGVIDVDQFWRHMRDAGLTDADIDKWFEEYQAWSPDPADGEIAREKENQMSKEYRPTKLITAASLLAGGWKSTACARKSPRSRMFTSGPLRWASNFLPVQAGRCRGQPSAAAA